MLLVLEDAWSSLKDKRRGNRPLSIPLPIGLDITTMMRIYESRLRKGLLSEVRAEMSA
jgi:hypothetical protein